MAPSLGVVYAARLLAGAAAIVPTAQAYIADLSSTIERSRRFVLVGSASFIGFLAGPALGTSLAGPVMMPFWMAALILLVGAALSLACWGPARMGEIAARDTTCTGTAGR